MTTLKRTGSPPIDRILSAVECAMEHYPNVHDWRTETNRAESPLGHRGSTPAEWIENAAFDMATTLITITNKAMVDTCEGCNAEATHSDSEGVPLCRDCWEALPLEDDCGETGGQGPGR